MLHPTRAILFCLATAGCATAPVAPPHPGVGPPIYLQREATCRSEGGVAPSAAIPDQQLCGDLYAALRRALDEVGYRVVESADDPHDATARIVAEQHPATDRDDRPTSFVTVQVLVEAQGQEVERATQDGNRADDGGEGAEVRTFASGIARELAHSPRMRSAGLVPKS